MMKKRNLFEVCVNRKRETWRGLTTTVLTVLVLAGW